MRNFYPERKWMKANNIDLEEASEESKFKKLMRNYEFNVKSQILEEADKFRKEKEEDKKVALKEVIEEQRKKRLNQPNV